MFYRNKHTSAHYISECAIEWNALTAMLKEKSVILLYEQILLFKPEKESGYSEGVEC